MQRSRMYRTDDAGTVAKKPPTDPQSRVELARSAALREPHAASPDAEVVTPAPAPQVGLSAGQRMVKRGFDLAGALVLLVLFGWVMILVAVAVRLSTGPQVIYGHTRVGRHGLAFKCLKFRSMVPDSDAALLRLLETDPVALAEWQRDFKLKNDPRITRVGRFIRRTSLDELPQIWNVLKGEMSLVGPRPVVEEEFIRYYSNAREHYLSVAPGLTGLWQVSGRSDLDYSQRVALDRSYVERWNLFTDLWIVLRTVGVMVGSSGAY